MHGCGCPTSGYGQNSAIAFNLFNNLFLENNYDQILDSYCKIQFDLDACTFGNVLVKLYVWQYT